MNKIITGLLMLILLGCSAKNEGENQDRSQDIEATASEIKETQEEAFQIELFTNADSSIGFRINKEGRRYIHQPHIPAVQGNKGFSSKQDAAKVGELMLHKISHDIVPPGISLQELDSLEVAY